MSRSTDIFPVSQENEVLRKQNVKLSEENGKLVGHKNHKQRIEYLVKLKKDNTKLQEVTNISAIIKRCFSLLMWILLTRHINQLCAFLFCFKGKWKAQNGDEFNARPHWLFAAGDDINPWFLLVLIEVNLHLYDVWSYYYTSYKVLPGAYCTFTLICYYSSCDKTSVSPAPSFLGVVGLLWMYISTPRHTVLRLHWNYNNAE